MNKKWKFASFVLASALFCGVAGTTFVGCKDYDDDINRLNERLDEVTKSTSEALDSKVKALETQLTTLTTAKDQLAKDLETAKADADKKVAEAQKAAEGAQGTATQALQNAQDALAKVATLETLLTSVNETIASLKEQMEATKNEVAEVKKLIDENAANAVVKFAEVNKNIDNVKSELVAELEVLSTSLTTLTTNIAQLQKDFDTANTAITGNTSNISKLQEQFLTLEKGLETQANALELYKKEVENQLGAKADVTTLDSKISELNTAIGGLQTTINGLSKKWNTDIETAIAGLASKTDVTKEIKTAVDDLEETINTKLGDYLTIQKFEEVLGEKGTITGQIATINTNLSTLSSLFSKRLTALLFAPTTYVDGIEAIPFTTLKYQNWIDLKGDEADGAKTVAINDGKTVAEYYISPSNVEKASVKGLTILLNNATNIRSKAGEEKQPIEVSKYTIDKGKMTVYLQKNTTETFAGEGDKFLVMALQATVEQTEAEKEAEIIPVVTSDWTRIFESSVIPYIHNSDLEKCDIDDKNGTTGKDSKFYSYKEIHSKGEAVVGDKDVCDTDGKYIVRRLIYNATEPFDLNTLVTVCDNSGHFYNAADYGLKFEFALVPYMLKDASEEQTNQANFAKIDENGKISSQSNNAIPNNADAVGREPMIQVKLVDTKHDNNVVDVRYFKIKWIAKQNTESLGQLKEFEDDFVCDKTYTKTVGTDIMNNKVYAKIDIDKIQFHALYGLDNNVYASEENAIAGTSYVDNLGTIKDVPATGSTVTHNLEWTYKIGDITEAEYNARKAERIVYARYVNKGNDADIIVFSLKLTLNINQMGVKGYLATQWDVNPTADNIDKKFQVNPALTSDELYGSNNYIDCQIIASLLTGYTKAGAVTPDNVLEAVDNAISAEFIFDKDRLSVLPGTGWSVSNDGAELLHGTEVAARINGGIIRLEESPAPTEEIEGEPTKAAQLLLGKNVPVKLVATNCASIKRNVDKFLVNFIDPLKMTVNQQETNLYDLISGGSFISIDKAVTLKEAFGEKRNVIWIKGNKLEQNDELMTWYHVGAITWDIDNAKTNLKIEGNSIIITNTCDNDWSDFANRYRLSTDEKGKTLTFENNSGSHIQQAFKVQIPVSIKTKWNPALADPTNNVVTVTINPGETE